MNKVSIIIPSCNEKQENIDRTIKSIVDNAVGEYEIIVGYNGELNRLPSRIPANYKGIFFTYNVGIKTNINTLVAIATGDYIFKTDAHCAFSKGFDEVLKANMQDDWIVMPRFKIIKDDWSIQMRDGQEEFYDYFYLSCPFTDKRGLRFKAGGHWKERTQERLNTLIDETPQIHGSGWFIKKDRFFELGGFPLQDPYGHGQEPIWLALKNWCMGGSVMVNKNCWYAHLHQDSRDRGYPEDKKATEYTYNYTADYVIKNKGHWLHNFDWFVEKFMPMPTWPDNWREQYDKYKQNT